MSVPDTVFIVPYRDRPSHKKIFMEYFDARVRPRTDLGIIDIILVNQADSRSFNRGAMKNIGFMYLRTTYPRHYKNITCVFHDIDSIPTDGFVMNYRAVHGAVNHLYGFKYALGGIFAIKGDDFEKTNGFPNHWGWGYEDNELSKRCAINDIKIDRRDLVDTRDITKIDRIDTKDEDKFVRYISPKEIMRYVRGTSDGIGYIKKLRYSRSELYLNIFTFQTQYPPERLVKYSTDLEDFMGNDVTRWVKQNFSLKRMPLVLSFK